MSHPNRLLNLLEFVTTVQTGSFTSAGDKLGLTGSAVGKSVSRLEARLGVKLLHRTTRRVSLTKEGSVYLESCLRLLEGLDITEQALTTGNDIPAGHVRVDLPGAFGRRHILPIINSIALRHDLLKFSLLFSERPADIISDGIDLAIRIGNLPDNSELIAKRLGSQRLVICASPDYLERYGVPVSPEELLTRDCISVWGRAGQHSWTLKDKSGQDLRFPVNSRFEMSDGEGMVGAVLAGCGLCQLPTWLINKELAEGSLLTVMDSYAGAQMPINVIWPKTPYPKPKIRVLVDELQRVARHNIDIFGSTKP